RTGVSEGELAATPAQGRVSFRLLGAKCFTSRRPPGGVAAEGRVRCRRYFGGASLLRLCRLLQSVATEDRRRTSCPKARACRVDGSRCGRKRKYRLFAPAVRCCVASRSLHRAA